MDALELLNQMPDESVDLILTDPPYNTGLTKKENNNTKTFKSKKKAKECQTIL